MLTTPHTPPVTFVSTETVRTFVGYPHESSPSFLQRVSHTLTDLHETPLIVMLFGPNALTRDARHLLTDLPGGADWPLLVAEGDPCRGHAIIGAQIFTLPESHPLQRVRFGGRVVGSVFEDDDARHCLLAGIGPRQVGTTEAAQTEETFSSLGQALESAGFSFADLVRTWFYNRDILSWYREFNRVRSAFYRLRPFRTGSMPASTGIEGRNPEGAALAMAAWAVKPLTPHAHVREIASPLQCPAPAYGSAFSRAMEINSGGRQRLLVSGTASIAPGGESIWPGDPMRQIDQTMEVIAAILHSRQLDFTDVVRASAYFKHANDLPYFETWLQSHGLDTMPYLPMHCDVCRDDLLFELELDACR